MVFSQSACANSFVSLGIIFLFETSILPFLFALNAILANSPVRFEWFKLNGTIYKFLKGSS
jgi:hypothetical protein